MPDAEAMDGLRPWRARNFQFRPGHTVCLVWNWLGDMRRAPFGEFFRATSVRLWRILSAFRHRDPVCVRTHALFQGADYFLCSPAGPACITTSPAGAGPASQVMPTGVAEAERGRCRHGFERRDADVQTGLSCCFLVSECAVFGNRVVISPLIRPAGHLLPAGGPKQTSGGR